MKQLTRAKNCDVVQKTPPMAVVFPTAVAKDRGNSHLNDMATKSASNEIPLYK